MKLVSCQVLHIMRNTHQHGKTLTLILFTPVTVTGIITHQTFMRMKSFCAYWNLFIISTITPFPADLQFYILFQLHAK